MSKFYLSGLVAALMATSAFAAGPGADNTFAVDASLSTITFSIVGVGTSSTSPLSGNFVMNLGTPTGSIGSRTWNVATELEDIDITTTADLNFGSLFINGSILAGNLNFRDFDSTDPSSEIFPGLDGNPAINDISDQPDVAPFGTGSTTLATGPAVSTGQIITDIFADANGGLSVFGTPSPLLLSSWAVPVNGTTFTPVPWNLEVADDNNLGVAAAGDTEAHIFVTAFVPTGNPATDPVIQLDFNIFGATNFVPVPEPTSLSLLALGGLGLLRRRRAL